MQKALLKQQAAETAQRIAAEVMELEDRLSPSRQIQKHPIPAVGAAALVGFAAAYWFPKEIKAAGKIGAGFLFELLRSHYEK